MECCVHDWGRYFYIIEIHEKYLRLRAERREQERAGNSEMNGQKGKFETLGVKQTDGGIQFAVRIAGDVPVSLLLYRRGKEEVEREIPFSKEEAIGDVRFLWVYGLNPKDYEYNYRINGNVVQDPCAPVLRGEKQFGVDNSKMGEHQTRCGFHTEEYDWEEDQRPRIPYEDCVMYLLHVRGFTKQSQSGVRQKGTFLGVAKKADYLKELGVNQVKLMPVYEFDEIIRPRPSQLGQTGLEGIPRQGEEQPLKINYWGYVEGYYFAPNRAYAATKDPVREFKDMVKALHARNIEVILEMFFPQNCDPRTICACLLHWMQEYHVDGFHLLGDQNLFHYVAKDPAFSDIKLINLYFDTDRIYGNGVLPARRNLAEYNDRFLITMRKLLKGEEDQLNEFVYLLRRNPLSKAEINYLTSHEGFTLMDLVSYDEKHNEENGEHNQDGTNANFSWNCGVEGPTRKKKILELRERQLRNAFLMLLLSQGVPMLVAGDEFGNSQGGNNNPYCQDNEVAWVDWRAAKKQAELTGFVRDAIQFRKRHRILHMSRELRGIDSLSCGYPDVSYHGNRAWYGAFERSSRQIGVMYCGEYANEDNFIYVAYNLHWSAQEFALPNIPDSMSWYIAIDTAKGVYPEGKEPELRETRIFTVAGRSIMVLIGRK